MAKIAITYPAGFYTYVARCLAEGFENHGHTCTLFDEKTPHSDLVQWVRTQGAALCFAINRFLEPGADWPPTVPYFSWVIDYRERGQDILGDFGDSHRLYFIMHPRAYGLDQIRQEWSMLPPGCRQSTPQPLSNPSRDFAFFGYIPKPIVREGRIGQTADGRPVPLAAFLHIFPSDLLRMSQLNVRAVRSQIDKTVDEMGLIPDDPHNLKLLIDLMLMRTIERTTMLDGALSISKALDIYGPPQWQTWERYAPFYRGNEPDPTKLIPLAQKARINLHNGCLAFHFRVIDAFAAGAFVMVQRTAFDDLPGGIAQHFRHYRDYIAFDVEQTGALAEILLKSEPMRERMAKSARKIALANHTWTHRAEQILRDAGIFAQRDKRWRRWFDKRNGQ